MLLNAPSADIPLADFPTVDVPSQDELAPECPDTAARCLFVVTRDIGSDPSAAHLLQVALWDRRRGATVDVFLVDRAVGRSRGGAAVKHLVKLHAAGARLYAHPPLVRRLRPEKHRIDVTDASDEDLATRLMDPSVRAVWC